MKHKIDFDDFCKEIPFMHFKDIKKSLKKLFKNKFVFRRNNNSDVYITDVFEYKLIS